MDLLIEIFGYVGSVLVVVSMLMSSVVKLRVINLIGSVISGAYALIIGSFPLALMNACLIVINLWNLKKLIFVKLNYDLVVCGTGDAALAHFLDHYSQDIQVYFPGFRYSAAKVDTAYLVFCEAEPAGVLLGNREEDGTIRVALDYTTPTYRDCSIGKFMFSVLPGEGVNRLATARPSEKHRPYLEKVGYELVNETYVKTL